MTPTMTQLIKGTRNEWRYGTRIIEADWENHTGTVIDESEGWCSLKQAKEYVERTLDAFSAMTAAKWEVEIYRYRIEVENLCGKKWTSIVV